MRPSHATNDAATPGAATGAAARRPDAGGQSGEAAAARAASGRRAVPLAQQVAFAEMLNQTMDEDVLEQAEREVLLSQAGLGAKPRDPARQLPATGYADLFAAVGGRGAMAGSPAGKEPPQSQLHGPQAAIVSASTDTSQSAGSPKVTAKCPAAVLRNVVQRIWVEAEATGKRQVSMQMDERLLPATRLSLRDAGGALDVAFECKQRATAELLGQDAPALAHDIASTLKRPVSLCVSVAPPEAPWSAQAFSPGPEATGMKRTDAAAIRGPASGATTS